MSAAAAPAEAAPVAPKGNGKKKLIIIIAAVLLLVLVGGGAAFFLMKKKAAAEADGEEADAPPAAAVHATKDAKHGPPPAFVPLDPFTVNLADKETERYAQIGVTLEIDDSKTADTLKAYMPAIRNNILMLLSHKTSAELLSLEGKQTLAKEIRRESLKPLGVVMEEEEPEEADAADHDTKKPKKKKKKHAPVVYPVTAVHFSNIIVQ